MKAIYTVFLAIAVCIGWGTSGVSAAAADSEITIGLAVAESGFMLAYDGDGTNAVKLWVDDRNAKGGLLGKKLRIVSADTKSDRAQGARAGQSVIDQGAQIVVVSCDYDFGAPAAAAAQRAGLVSMFLCAEDPKAGVQGAGPYAFTSSIAAQVQGATAIQWAHDKLAAKKFYVLLDTATEYDKSVCAGADWAVKQTSGVEIVGSDTFKNDDPSIQAQITRIASLPQKPDAIVVCSYVPGGASAVRQIRAAGLDTPILAGSAMDGTYWLDTVPGLKDFYVPVQASVHGNDPRPDVNAFVKRFTEKFGHPPATTYGVPAYPFLDLWATAVEKAGSAEAKKLVPVMEQYKDQPTMIGPRTFTGEWHIQTSALMQILKFDNGKVTVIGEEKLSEALPKNVLFRTK
ncbi:branched-chain amino acid transport system substrate-binding protein [Bradyrhizobium sp. USDA 4449]